MERKQESPKDVIVLELNEFNLDLLKAACAQYTLPNLKHLLDTAHSSQYKTQDRYNSGYLEPWVQWVSVHSGVPSTQHKIKHLGDVPDLDYTQCWETLSQHQIKTGVWGVMNGARRNQENVLFFLPDPWTFSEAAYPAPLNSLLALPRYLSKNYRNLSFFKILNHGFKLLKYIARSGVALKIVNILGKLLGSLIKRGPKHYVFISYFDWVSTLLFIQMKKKHKTQCNFLFLNSLAHIQHHHWTQGPEVVTPPILFGLKVIDKVLFALKQSFPEDELVIHNGLSQMNTNHEKAWVLYRQKDPTTFFSAMQLKAIQIEQNMTHDGHAFFASQEDCEKAYQQLKMMRINNKPLFHVELYKDNDKKLFYRLDFTDDVPPGSQFTCQEKLYRFGDYFDSIVTRTGRHIPMGNVLSYNITFPDHMFNHDFNQSIYRYFNLSPIKNMSETLLKTAPVPQVQSDVLCNQ